MSDIENQQATAVAEVAPLAASFAPEAPSTVETTESTTPSLSLEASLPDLVVTGFTADSATTEASVVAEVKVAEEELKVFTPREGTDLIVNRRENPDGSYEFILTDQDDSWLRKNEHFVTSAPVGKELTQQLLKLLADETETYFTVLESDGDKTTLGDKGDMRNLTRLQAFVEDIPLMHILTDGVRSINAGSRLLQKALRSDAKVINGAMTIAYQVSGHEGVMKYRLVGEINRELVVKVAELAGQLMIDVGTPPEPKQKKPKKLVAEVQQGTAEVVEAKVQPAATPARPARPHVGGDANLQRLTAMVEALVVDNREIRKALQTTQGLNQALRQEIKESRGLNRELLDTNTSMLESMSLILDVLNK